MREIKVKINEKEVVLKKLALGQYPELFSRIKKLPALAGELIAEGSVKGAGGKAPSVESLSNETILKKLPNLFSVASDEVISLLSFVSGIDEKELRGEWGLDDATELLRKVLEINNTELIKKNIQGVVGDLGFGKQKEVKAKAGTKK